MAYNLDLNKLEKPYCDAYISQIPLISVQPFERSQNRSLIQIVNIAEKI